MTAKFSSRTRFSTSLEAAIIGSNQNEKLNLLSFSVIPFMNWNDKNCFISLLKVPTTGNISQKYVQNKSRQ